MVIPVGAPNTAAALDLMNYVYEPKNAAKLAAYINYVTPVKGVQQVFQKTDPSLANDNLIFPTTSFLKKCTPNLNPRGGPKAVEEVTNAFQNVITK